MKHLPRIISCLATTVTLALLITVTATCDGEAEKPKPIPEGDFGDEQVISWDFEGADIPEGWAIGSTNQKGTVATWEIMEDATAPSGGKILSLIDPYDNSGETFNLCWTPEPVFLDGEIEVMFRANEGSEDQGGGIMWRVLDKDNYYVARFNPLEDNFRLYYVRDGNRKQLESATLTLPTGEWHSMKIVVKGNRFDGYLNGEKVMEVEDDHFTEPGGCGVWTKADGATSFDDFVIKTVK